MFVWFPPLSIVSFDPPSFLKSLATIHEIERINAAGFLPGVRLGYLMCDTCSYASKALQNVVHMLAVNGSLTAACNYTDFRPGIKIILGALYSEESIAVARLLNVYMVPLVSHTYYSAHSFYFIGSMFSFMTTDFVKVPHALVIRFNCHVAVWVFNFVSLICLGNTLVPLYQSLVVQFTFRNSKAAFRHMPWILDCLLKTSIGAV